MKKDDVREKTDTPKKLSQLRRDISKLDGTTGLEQEVDRAKSGFMIKGHAGQVS